MWEVLVIFVINLICIKGEMCGILIPDNGILFGSVSECVKQISQQELQYRPTVVIDTQYVAKKNKSSVFTTEVIEKLMTDDISVVIISVRKTKNIIHNTLIIEDTIFDKNYTVRALVVLYFETCDEIFLFDFSVIIIELKHLVIVSEFMSNDCVIKLQDIFNIDLYDLTFMFQDQMIDQQNLYSFISRVDRYKCIHVTDKPTHINTCVNGTLQNNIVFPSKNPKNLNKCPVRVGMSTLYPFSQIKNKDLLVTYDSIDEAIGSDMEVIKIFVENINATIDLHYVFKREENPFGEYEFLKYLSNGSLDICAGGMYRIYGDTVAYSGVYSRQAVMWIYYAERVDRSWRILVNKLNGIYIFLIFYISYSLIWYVIREFDGDAASLKKTLVYGWGALVGATSLQDPRSIKQKCLNLMYLVMSIHFSAYISIKLYSFLTIRDPPHMFTNNDEIMASGMVPYLKESTKYFVDDKKYIEFANTSSECKSFVDCAEKTFTKKGLTVMLQANFYDFQSATTVNGEARILRVKENILTVYHEMIIRKDSPLVNKFHQTVQSLFEGGITEKLYKDAIGLLVMAKADTATSIMMMHSYSCQAGCAITFMQFAGVFYLWFFGCILSCIVFGLEIFVKREIN